MLDFKDLVLNNCIYLTRFVQTLLFRFNLQLRIKKPEKWQQFTFFNYPHLPDLKIGYIWQNSANLQPIYPCLNGIV